MASDVARAYFNAPSTSSVFVELCEEDRGFEHEKRVENFQCRCMARGPQLEFVRNVSATCNAAADFELYVGIRACSDI